MAGRGGGDAVTWAPSRVVPAAPWALRGSAVCRGWPPHHPPAPRAPGVLSCPRGRPTRRAPPRCSPCAHTCTHVANARGHTKDTQDPNHGPINPAAGRRALSKSQICSPKASTRVVLSPPSELPPPLLAPLPLPVSTQAPPEPAQPQQPGHPPPSLLPLPTPWPHAPLEVPQRLLGAGHAVEEPFSPPVVAVPAAEAHPGRQLQLDVVGLLGPRPQELEAALGVEEDGVGVLLVVGYDRLEGVELPRGERDKRTSAGQNLSGGSRETLRPPKAGARGMPRNACRWGSTSPKKPPPSPYRHLPGVGAAWVNQTRVLCAARMLSTFHPLQEPQRRMEGPLEPPRSGVTAPRRALQPHRPGNPHLGLAAPLVPIPTLPDTTTTSPPSTFPLTPEENPRPHPTPPPASPGEQFQLGFLRKKHARVLPPSPQPPARPPQPRAQPFY